MNMAGLMHNQVKHCLCLIEIFTKSPKTPKNIRAGPRLMKLISIYFILFLA